MKTNFFGNKPFVYISFIEADRDQVGELITAFEETGIYYAYADRAADDAGAMIRRCSVFVTAISAAALKDERFLGEITSAKNSNKAAVAAMLERGIEIPGFVQLQINRFQNIFLYRHEDSFSLKDEIRRANAFSKCVRRNVAMKQITLFSAFIIVTAALGVLIFWIAQNRAESSERTETTTAGESAYSYSATAGLQYELEGDTVSITGYFGNDTAVTVPETYTGYPVTKIAASAFKDTAVQSVILPPSVTVIEDEAFYNCAKLEHVISFGKDVSIGENVFYHCKTKNIEYQSSEAL